MAIHNSLPYAEWMNVDHHGNHNNHDAVLIYRDLYKANRALFDLQNQTTARIRAIADKCRAMQNDVAYMLPTLAQGL